MSIMLDALKISQIQSDQVSVPANPCSIYSSTVFDVSIIGSSLPYE